MQDFKNLKVWQKAHELALFTYQITAEFPKEELFGLRNTLRKTSVDIPGFIAEGCAKSSDQEFGKLISMAIGLNNRLEYYVLVAKDLQLLGDAIHRDYTERIVEVRKMLSGFKQRLVRSFPVTHPPDLFRSVVGDQERPISRDEQADGSPPNLI